MTDATPNFSIRSEPATRTAPEVLARIFGREEKLPEKKARLEASCRPQEILTEGHPIDVAELVGTTASGALSKRGTAGKLVATLLDLGGEFQAGRSTYRTADKVVPVNEKREGKQTPTTVDYVVKMGEEVEHMWLDFPFRGSRATLVGSEITFRYQKYKMAEFMDMLLDGGH